MTSESVVDILSDLAHAGLGVATALLAAVSSERAPYTGALSLGAVTCAMSPTKQLSSMLLSGTRCGPLSVSAACAVHAEYVGDASTKVVRRLFGGTSDFGRRHYLLNVSL